MNLKKKKRKKSGLIHRFFFVLKSLPVFGVLIFYDRIIAAEIIDNAVAMKLMAIALGGADDENNLNPMS